MISAVDRVAEIDRNQCRRAAEQRFSLQRMAREHERLYRRLLERESSLMRRIPAAGRRLDQRLARSGAAARGLAAACSRLPPGQIRGRPIGGQDDGSSQMTEPWSSGDLPPGQGGLRAAPSR